MQTEQITQIPFTLGGIDYIHYDGTDSDGDVVDYIDRVQPDDKGNLLRFFPDETRIFRDTSKKKKGAVDKIYTAYRCGVIGGNGEVIEGSDFKADGRPNKLEFITVLEDQRGFEATLGKPVKWSGNNGLIRAKFGFNNRPLYYTAPVKDANGVVIHVPGEVIQYTEAEKAAPPTFDYYPAPTPPAEPTPAP